MLVVGVFFNDTATTEIYALSLHDPLPIFVNVPGGEQVHLTVAPGRAWVDGLLVRLHGTPPLTRIATYLDRKSPRLNSRHANISYAAFCFKDILGTHHQPRTDQDGLAHYGT